MLHREMSLSSRYNYMALDRPLNIHTYRYNNIIVEYYAHK